MSELREHITTTISVRHEALPDKDGVLLCACGSYFDDKAEHGAHVADTLIAAVPELRRVQQAQLKDDVFKTSKHHCADCGIDLALLSKHIHHDEHGGALWVKCGRCADE